MTLRADQIVHVNGCEVLSYLVLQQGALDHLKADPIRWVDAYEHRLQEQFREIAPHLPAKAASILDIGGGMGGIDILLSRHFGGAAVSILDGEADEPLMRRHGETFNNLRVTRRFMMANGVRQFLGRAATDPGPVAPYDLVVSFASWCFHFPPAAYLDFVAACCHPATVVILDVREGRADWLQQLLAVFDPVAANVFPKFTRWVLKPRA